MSMTSGRPGKTPLSLPPSTLPPEPPATRFNRATLIAWLVAIGLIFLYITLQVAGGAVRADAQRLDDDLALVVEQINAVPTPNAEVQALNAQLQSVLSDTQQLQAINQQLAAPRPDWPAIMGVIGQYDPAQLQLQVVTTDNTRVTLSGRAAGDLAVNDYKRWLEQSPLFSRVIVQSIRVLPTPVITMTRTPTPAPGSLITGTATPTPTLDLRDAFEPDNTDADAKPIAVGDIQQRNFYPALDVDTATFLAKSGRYYRVSTAGLAPGVDTFLTVSVGDRTYTNDDAKPGTLASEVIFQNPGADVMAIVRVTNRGQFGADKTYQLLLEEIVPTPTATPTPVGPTATPTVTPTPLPDLRDAYEPDDTTPKPILAGQPQLRNFYPDGDVDQVTFLAKSGRFYRVYTTDLAPGVDTFLTVGVGGAIYTNDDVRPGTLASEVTFGVTGPDIVATVRVTNRGLYGPDKRYQLIMEEFQPTATPPGPSPTPIGPTVTPPPDPRDRYEIDDVVPTPIAPGETQDRNFYPFGDVDKVTFNAKAGRTYILYTSDLASGVDTYITATLGAMTYENDDYPTAPPGVYASAICFTATVDSPLFATITNKQPFFGPDRTYRLSLRETAGILEPCVPPAPSAPDIQSAAGRALFQRAVAPPRSIGLAQDDDFLPVEFVIIIELKLTP